MYDISILGNAEKVPLNATRNIGQHGVGISQQSLRLGRHHLCRGLVPLDRDLRSKQAGKQSAVSRNSSSDTIAAEWFANG